MSVKETWETTVRKHSHLESAGDKSVCKDILADSEAAP